MITRTGWLWPSVAAGLLLGLAFGPASAAAEAPPPAAPAPATPGKREAAGHAQAIFPFQFVTPKEACGELPPLSFADGKATLSLPCKGGKVTVFYAQGQVGVDAGDGSGRSLTRVPVPRDGFSQPFEVALVYADGSTGLAALGFALGKKPGELVCRNFAVAAVQIGDVSLYVIDDNCNGKYNDAGEDALYAGGCRLATPLGTTAMLGNRPHTFTVSENGQKMSVKESDVKLGLAGLFVRNGWDALAGAVVKGPDGSGFAIRPDQASFLPVGGHTLVFALLADAGDRRALIRGESLSITVEEPVKDTPPKVAMLNLGTVHMPPPELTWNAQAEQLTIAAPKADGVACAGGKITYLFPLPPACFDLVEHNRQGQDVLKFRNVRMQALPTPYVLRRLEQNLLYGLKYRVDLSWAVGLGPMLKSSADIEIPWRGTPPKK